MDERNKVVTYEYRFDRAAPLDAIRETLTLSVLSAENLHGSAKVRLDGRFRLDAKKRRCVLDASTEVGEDIARLFTGYLSREFGERSFTVRRTRESATVGGHSDP